MSWLARLADAFHGSHRAFHGFKCMWFTETPWPPVLFSAVVIVVCAAVWIVRKTFWPLVLAGVFLLVGVIAFVVDSQVVTPREQVELKLNETVAAIENGEFERVLANISPVAVDLREDVERSLQYVKFLGPIRLGEVYTTLAAADSRATTKFRATATAQALRQQGTEYGTTYWDVGWQREAGEWKIISATRLDETGRRLSNAERF